MSIARLLGRAVYFRVAAEVDLVLEGGGGRVVGNRLMLIAVSGKAAVPGAI